MKYLLFGYDRYYPSGNDLIAMSNDMDKLIAFAKSHTYKHHMDETKLLRYQEYEIHEVIEGNKMRFVWSNDPKYTLGVENDLHII